jgi:sugar lactone lactonase YvrE
MRFFARTGLFFLFVMLLSLTCFAQTGIITTYAGPGLPADNSLATEQAIDAPYSVASDGASGFYIAVSSQHQVYRVKADGRMSLVAGNGVPGFSGDGGPATSAQLYHPSGVAVDASGNLFIADSENNRIRKVTVGGLIITVAGDGTAGFGGDSSEATSAQLNYPMGIAVDSAGNLFIADSQNHRIRKVTYGGQISTVAGNGAAGFDEVADEDNIATEHKLNNPTAVAVDASGNLFIADTVNQRIRKVTTDKLIHTVAGTGSQGFGGDAGQATSAIFNFPVALAVDGAGNLWVADAYNFRIRKITADGAIATVAGKGTAGFSGDGSQATAAELYLPRGVTVDASGNLFIADYVNRRVRKVTSSGVISTVAGNGIQGFSGDGGKATSARFHLPTGLATDAAGNLYIADLSNYRIRKVTPGGIVSTVAGNGNSGFSGEGGQATSAQLSGPAGVAVDKSGNLFIADYQNQRVLKVTPAGVLSTVAGNGTQGFSGDGGPATAAQLNQPWAVAVDISGNLFIADLMNHSIRKVTSDGRINTIAGIGVPGFSGDDAQAAAAQLNYPVGVALDSAGNLYIADSGNHCIRKVTSAGIISTVAGNGIAGFGGDGGPATVAHLNHPASIAIDNGGNLFIADYNNNRIRKVTAGGVIKTVAGIGTAGFSGDGRPAISAQLNFPMGLALDATGSLFIADYENDRIRRVAPENATTSFFPQVAVGNGYSTFFTVTNTGSTAASGILILRDSHGDPLPVNGTLMDSDGIAQSELLGSVFSITVPAGETVYFSATGLIPVGPVQVGWGRLESAAGLLTGAAAYRYSVGLTVRTTAGALQSQLMQYAAAAIEEDSSQGRQIAYAIANPGNQAVSVKLALVGQDGTAGDYTFVTISPGQQIAEYLWQDPAGTNFKGSLVFESQAGGSFVAIALQDDQGWLTAIPLSTGTLPDSGDGLR